MILLRILFMIAWLNSAIEFEVRPKASHNTRDHFICLSSLHEICSPVFFSKPGNLRAAISSGDALTLRVLLQREREVVKFSEFYRMHGRISQQVEGNASEV